MARQDWETAEGVLRLATQLVEAIDAGVRQRGFEDVRPSHGFAFLRISAGDATVADVAAHLGVTKQAASQLVDQLVTRGYVERRPHPTDARAWLLALTVRGRACAAAATESAEETIGIWRRTAGATQVRGLRDAVRSLAEPGPVRPLSERSR